MNIAAHLPILRRRIFVIGGLILACLLAVGSVRLAATLTATAAPLSVAPPDAAALAGQLTGERGRSADLEAQLSKLANDAANLSAGLVTAKGQIATDAATAATLRSQVAQTQTALTALQRKLAAATTKARPTARPPATGGGDDEGD